MIALYTIFLLQFGTIPFVNSQLYQVSKIVQSLFVCRQTKRISIHGLMQYKPLYFSFLFHKLPSFQNGVFKLATNKINEKVIHPPEQVVGESKARLENEVFVDEGEGEKKAKKSKMALRGQSFVDYLTETKAQELHLPTGTADHYHGLIGVRKIDESTDDDTYDAGDRSPFITIIMIILLLPVYFIVQILASIFPAMEEVEDFIKFAIWGC